MVVKQHDHLLFQSPRAAAYENKLLVFAKAG